MKSLFFMLIFFFVCSFAFAQNYQKIIYDNIGFTSTVVEKGDTITIKMKNDSLFINGEFIKTIHGNFQMINNRFYEDGEQIFPNKEGQTKKEKATRRTTRSNTIIQEGNGMTMECTF